MLLPAILPAASTNDPKYPRHSRESEETLVVDAASRALACATLPLNIFMVAATLLFFIASASFFSQLAKSVCNCLVAAGSFAISIVQEAPGLAPTRFVADSTVDLYSAFGSITIGSGH